jgi:mediator of replication checkpoint protein 1
VLKNVAKVRGEKPKRPLERSEFVEAEAQESDDDEMFGFGQRKANDGDEEDGEDLDKNLEVLVDDRAMDEETVAPQLVFEKFQYVCWSFFSCSFANFNSLS